MKHHLSSKGSEVLGWVTFILLLPFTVLLAVGALVTGQIRKIDRGL